MAIMRTLCKWVLQLYPSEFPTTFAEEILTNFDEHYAEERHQGKAAMSLVRRQLTDIANLASAGFVKRIGMVLGQPDSAAISATYGRTVVEGGAAVHNVVWKVHFAWQTDKEARWLTEMSKAGWHFIDYKPFWYWFRHLDQPLPYEFHFERHFFFWWQAREEAAFLDHKAQEGWEYIKFCAGWYYFRRPLA